MCNPFCTSAWELSLLLQHFHPGVRYMARQIGDIKGSSEQEGYDLNVKTQSSSAMIQRFAAFQPEGFALVPGVYLPPRIVASLKKFRKNPILNGPTAYK